MLIVSRLFPILTLVNYRLSLSNVAVYSNIHTLRVLFPTPKMAGKVKLFYINLLIRGSPEIMQSKWKCYEIKSSQTTHISFFQKPLIHWPSWRLSTGTCHTATLRQG